MKKFLTYCLLLIAAFLPVAAASNTSHIITYLGMEKGLSNNAVRCIFQDHKGFMWFGTYDGLNRYDGNVFKVFRNNFNDSSSLVNNWVLTINEDVQHKLWVGTRQGLNVLDNVTGKFSSVYYQLQGSGKTARISAVVRDIKRDAGGNMLIATENLGLLICPAGSYTARQVPFSDGSRRINAYDVPGISIADNGDTWLLVQGRGLCMLDKNAGQVKLINSTVATADCIKADKDYLWIGTPNGLWKYNIAANLYQDSFTEENGKLAYNKVAGLYLDKSQQLWVATNGGGITVIRTTDGAVTAQIPCGTNNYSLTSSSAITIFEDLDGRKWIGTLRGGINIIDPKKDRFQSVLQDTHHPNGLVSNFIYAFCETPGGDIWIGTDGGGVSRWNRATSEFTNYVHQTGNATALSDNFVTNIRCDENQQIWISTFWGGINRYDSKTNAFRHYNLINPVCRTESKTVYLLYKDRNNGIWAGTFGKGAINSGALYRYDSRQDKFQLFDATLPDLFTMQEDRAGNIWAGNLRSLIKIDTQNKHHQVYTLGNPVRAIHEDAGGNFWVGTEGGGLLRFDPGTGKILRRYTTNEGLCNNAVLNILEDKEGNLWISTFYGLSRFNIQQQTFTNFYQGDGLTGDQFNYNAALALRSGELMFGGIRGMNIFHPADIVPSGQQPKLLFTDIRIDNQPMGQRPDYIKDRIGDEVHRLEVPYRNAIFSFDFTALDFSTANKISYAYYMQGWDKSWNQAGNNRIATYTHLSSGHYTFRVKSTNPEGQWIDNEISIEVIVLPPWYTSWWAFLVYLLLFLGVVYIYLVYTNRQRKLKYQVAFANMQTEKERELNEKKISFFTNVSHEFRTPLTLIINPIKDMMAKEEVVEHHRQELNLVYKNARRLLRLLDQLLLFRKADSDTDHFKPAPFNFTELCHDVFQSFEQLAQLSNITFNFSANTGELWVYGDREKLEVVLFNLVSNAMKYTPPGGKVMLKLQHREDTLTIFIEDSGCGIPAGTGHKIFDKFFRAEGEGQQPGFGIGLYLVKQFTEMHHGKVDVESRQGGGTVFRITFPGTIVQKNSGTNGNDYPEKNKYTQEMTAELEEKEAGTEQDPGAIISLKRTMLIVDDDPQIRQYISGMFKAAFHIVEAGDGKEGLEKVTALVPDIVISDIKMQLMSGIELCKAIKKSPALNHIPVILLTGSAAEDSKLESASIGGDHYITKPFEKDYLMATVQTVLQTIDNLRNYFLNEVTLRKNELKIPGQYQQFVERCIAIVEENLDNDAFNIKVLAREIGMSHSSVYKKIREVSGESLRGFVRFVRLRKAAELMINTSLNVNEIGFQVGINDVKYFREQFNKVFGMNPSEYIRKYRKVFSPKFKLEKPGKKS
ncbi:two-component regulator propeller domain-containing protein [Chitinophaga sp. Cy-1792]|uniref:hybrid sensor histidine kinase/response regulator transcription factor n=1 Tax=Chitinophaga sp. Cy-1792 TaxID=2608339 RepID=UPI00141F44C1|nr:two-component regulator propeller domain-containing protein [Chitinophaga sp. Cy-1792]